MALFAGSNPASTSILTKLKIMIKYIKKLIKKQRLLNKYKKGEKQWCDHIWLIRNFNWDDNHWPDAFIFFGNWEATAFKKGSTKALQQPLLDFAKSYLRYSLSFKQEQRARYEGTIFKCLEKALLEFGFSSDISYLTPAILDRAAEFARTRYTPSSCYHIGRNLQKLVEFLNEKNLIQNHIEWRNPNSRPSDTCKTGLKAEKIRQKKLPTDIALNALAEVFSSNPSSASDIFTTSTCALLLCVLINFFSFRITSL